MAAPAAASAKPVVAEDLSRMEGEYGAKMIGKLKQMHVLIIGLRGLGVEVAKNLILAGPHTVQVYDEGLVEVADLGTNFYLLASDVGANRAHASLRQLGELNPNVNVGRVTTINAAEIQKYDVVCVTDVNVPLASLLEWNEAARTRFKHNPDTGLNEHHPTAFIVSGISGVSGFIFSDFGDEFHVFDPDGIPVRSVVIDHVSRAVNGIVTIDGDRHLLSDGDLLKFEEVHGMSDQFPLVKESEADEKTFKHGEVITDINSILEIKATKNPKKFSIGDTSKLGEYANGGVATQIKQSKTFKFQSLAKQIVNPAFIMGYMDFTKFGRDAALHLARLAIWKFNESKGRFPALHSEADADEVVKIAESINAENAKLKQGEALVVEGLDLNVVRQIALYNAVELPPLAALFGGIVAQEITKQTGKYSPMQQWFHFDALELVAGAKPPADSAPIGSRYDSQIAVFGKAVQDKIAKQNVFLVGCGALGCEFIKAFSVMGLGTAGGSIHMTDDDRIELSNLSRQFLFRRKHVGHAKSKSAAEAALEMNPDISKCLTAMENRVEPKSEDIFTDAFWDRLDFVVNALDNQQARKYVDGKCVIHKKPLFESGTLGTQANSVICLPFKTPSYAEGAVAGEEQGIAKCTLRNFPSLDLHCIEWAREKFDDLYVSGADAVNSLLEDREQYLQKLKQDPLAEADALKSVKNWLELAAKPTFEQCAKVMFDEFVQNYRNSINDLTHAFPRDARIKDNSTGADLGLFWHGHKRFPQSAEFNPEQAEHVDYIFHGANILASVFKIPEQTKDQVRALLPKLAAECKKWAPSNVKITLDEDKNNPNPAAEKKPDTPSEEDHLVVARITHELRQLDLSKFTPLVSADFEKDNDFNHHIDWITSATNLRCWNYFIKETTRQKCRMISGKIIPAIATTTATITGFIQIEMYKYIMGAALESFRAASINLASNVFCVENLPDPNYKKSGLDPQTYMQVVAIPEKHTIWDQVVIDTPNLTLQQFLDKFAEVHHGCVIDTLIPIGGASQGKVLFNSMDSYDASKKDLVKKRLATSVVDLWTEIVGPIFPADRKYLLFDCSVEDESGNSGIVPTIRYNFRQ